MSTTLIVDEEIVEKARQKFHETVQATGFKKDAWIDAIHAVVDDYAKSIGAFTEVTAIKISDDQEITEQQIEAGLRAVSGEGMSREEAKEILVTASRIPSKQMDQRILCVYETSDKLGFILSSHHVRSMLKQANLMD